MMRADNVASELEVERSLKTGALNLRGYGLKSVPDQVFEMSHLIRLDLSQNDITSIPEEISHLTNLKELLVNQNVLGSLPNAICSLQTLEFLDVALNGLTELPSEFCKLSNLEYLRLGGNPLGSLPPDIGKLKVLRSLVANDIGLDQFPIQITDLQALEALNLSQNSLVDLPQEFTKLTSLRSFVATESDLIRPPIEIISRGPRAIINYLHAFDKSEGSFQIREAKLLVVGQGAVGKTCLMNRLIHDHVNPSLSTTEGIHIDKWSFEGEDGEPFCVNFWDFGGQEIYHSTHQFFLTKRSLYLFVWDARKEDNLVAFDYWLNVVKLLSDSSPLIVVLNKIDERVKTIDEDSLREKFSNIRSFQKVSAITGVGITQLREDIKKSIIGLEHVGDVLPKAWIEIRNHLESLNEHSIPYVRYLSICARFGLNAEKANYLSQYFHDLGVFLHFQENPILKQVVFLEPEWATNAVYKIVDTKEVQLANGSFSYDQLEDLWKEYPQDSRIHLLELMKKFEICFQIPETTRYVVPELLSAKRPSFHWDDRDSLHFLYKYEFMPAGVMTRFIVRTHDMNKGIYWKTGVVLKLENTAALIVSEPLSRRIRIQINGDEKKSLLAIIRREIDYIHKTLNQPVVSAMLPCTCDICRRSDEPYFHDFDYLKRARARRKWTVECKKSLEDVRVDDILGEVRTQRSGASQITVYGDYYESQVSNVISIGTIQLNREYSDHLRQFGVAPDQYSALLIALSHLHKKDLETLRGYASSIKSVEDNTWVNQIWSFASKHNVPVLQNLLASSVYEVMKYMFLA